MTEEYDPLECDLGTLDNLILEKTRQICARKEEILEAFIAKYGYEPDEMILNEQPSTGKFWVEKRNNWISVKDRLPEHQQFFLGISSQGNMVVLRCDRQFNGLHEIDYVFMSPDLMHQVRGVTHWMPLPSPPKEIPE